MNTLQHLSRILPAKTADQQVYVVGYQAPAQPGPDGKKSFGRVRQQVCDTIGEASAYVSMYLAKNYNIFYAMGLFAQGWHDCPLGRRNPDGTPKQVVRLASNVAALQSLWVDIDCTPGKNYATKAEGLAALVAATKALNLPLPIIVDSGGGIHAYWPLSQPLTVERWKLRAELLKACLRHQGLSFDAGCTADAARILRPVGTLNVKYDPPRPVKLVGGLHERMDDTAVTGALVAYAKANNVVVAKAAQPARATALPPHLQQIAGRYDNIPDVPQEKKKNARRIIDNCEQVREAGEADYNTWRLMMTVMNVCENGREEARRVSSASSMHTDAAFDAKFDDVEVTSTGPGKCGTFDSYNPGVCANCKYRGKLSSPAELGVVGYDEAQAAAEVPAVSAPVAPSQPAPAQPQPLPTATMPGMAPVPVVASAPQAAAQPAQAANSPAPVPTHSPAPQAAVTGFADPVSVPEKTAPLPRGVTTTTVDGQLLYRFADKEFIVKDDMVYAVKEEEVDGAAPIRREYPIIPGTMSIAYCVEEEHSANDRSRSYIFWIKPEGLAARHAALDAETLANDTKLYKWFINNALSPRGSHKKQVIAFMSAYINKLQGIVPVFTVRGAFGWTELKSQVGEVVPAFVYGDTLIAANRANTEVGLSAALQGEASECLAARGTLEGWKKGAEFYTKHNIISGQLALAAGFGSLLAAFAPGNAKNAIFNLYSPHSGSGKTTMQLAALSVNGDPTAQLLTASDTGNSRFRVIGQRKNLVVAIDEVTNLKDQELSDLIFGLSTGKEKRRLGEGGREALKSGSFNCITIVSANNTVCDKMLAYDRNREAEIKRVLEIPVPYSDAPAREANDMIEAMQANCGTAGRAFVKWLLDGPMRLPLAIALMKKYVDKYQGDASERFWFNGMAMVCTAAQLANEAGITNLDVEAIHKLGMECVETLRRKLRESKNDVETALGEFLNDSLGSTLVVASAKLNRSQMAMPDKLSNYVWRYPQGEVNVRLEADTGTLCIRQSALKTWCKDKGYDMEAMLAPHEKAGSVATDSRSLTTSTKLGSDIGGKGKTQVVIIVPAPILDTKEYAATIRGDAPKKGELEEALEQLVNSANG